MDTDTWTITTRLELAKFPHGEMLQISGSDAKSWWYDKATNDWASQPNPYAIPGYARPDTCKITLFGEQLKLAQFNERGFPVFSGPAKDLLLWKINQQIHAGKVQSLYRTNVRFECELLSTPVSVPVEDRLAKIEICPVCGEHFLPSELEDTRVIGKEGVFIAHKDCAIRYKRLQTIDYVCEIFDNVFIQDIARPYRAEWGKTLTYKVMDNKETSKKSEFPRLLFCTPLGDMEIQQLVSVDLHYNKRIIKEVENLLTSRDYYGRSDGELRFEDYEQLRASLKKIHREFIKSVPTGNNY